MSATFRLEKKKVSQHELRRLMNEQKQARNGEVKKIDSPFAKYENGNILTCVLCKSIVRSESVWTVHINAKQHKENLALAKQLKEKIENQSKKPQQLEDRIAGIKRSISDMRSDIPEKKLKGILKNSSAPSSSATTSNADIPQNSEVSHTEKEEEQSKEKSAIPDDFFDTKPKSTVISTKKSEKEQLDEKMQVEEPLPEGFFDDPVKDAKARHQEYKDPVEEEWSKFQKEIKEAETQSKNIINEEHEDATVERQLDEIDEQIRNWSRYAY